MVDEIDRTASGSHEEATEPTVSLEDVVLDALAKGNRGTLREIVMDLHYADLADLIEHLPRDDRIQFAEETRSYLDAAVLSELDEIVRDDIVRAMDHTVVAEALSELESDDAVALLEDMDLERQQQVLDTMPEKEREVFEETLSYPEDSAGRLMQREVVTVPLDWNVGQCIDFMRDEAERDDNDMPNEFYNIIVVDRDTKPVGTLSLSRLMRTRRQIGVAEIMEADLHAIDVQMDQEEVAFVFRQRDLVSAPVVNEGGRLLGSITVDDVVDVIHEEHEEDIMRLGGVSEDDLYRAVISTTRSRFSWLVVNLLTAILASIVIGFFDATIEQIVALAVLMPIVASMGGNAGTQTLTVTVRALATKELTPSNAARVIGKELLVGSINGVLFAILSGLVAWLWFQSPTLGAVIAAAMIINMFVAGLAGTTIPIFLERQGVDPAVASTVFLTTVTDVIGFFAFLGLAAIFLI